GGLDQFFGHGRQAGGELRNLLQFPEEELVLGVHALHPVQERALRCVRERFVVHVVQTQQCAEHGNEALGSDLLGETDEAVRDQLRGDLVGGGVAESVSGEPVGDRTAVEPGAVAFLSLGGGKVGVAAAPGGDDRALDACEAGDVGQGKERGGRRHRRVSSLSAGGGVGCAATLGQT